MAIPAMRLALSINCTSLSLGLRTSRKYIPKVPSTRPSCDMIGLDQPASSPADTGLPLKFTKFGSERKSGTKKLCRRETASLHGPPLGPTAAPSVAVRYDSGRFGAAAYRKCKPSSSTKKIEH